MLPRSLSAAVPIVACSSAGQPSVALTSAARFLWRHNLHGLDIEREARRSISSRRCGARLACSGSGRVTIVSSRYGASRGVSRPSHHATWAEQPLASQAVQYNVKLRRARNIARTPQSSRRVTRCRVTPRHATGPASNPPSPTDDTFRTMLRRAYPASHVVRNCTSIDRCG